VWPNIGKTWPVPPPEEAAAANSPPRPAPEPELAGLCRELGVATEFWDWQGRHSFVPRATLVSVLAALGVNARDPSAALSARRHERLRRMLPPSLVVRSGAPARFGVHVPVGRDAEVWVELEAGGVRTDVSAVPGAEPQVATLHHGGEVAELTWQLPADLPLGWHSLRVRLAGGGEKRSGRCVLVVVPGRLQLPDPVDQHRLWGWTTQLYALRSRRSWGIGDLVDLADLAAWSGRTLDAGFVVVNPLHATEPVSPIEPSPYLPTSRRFASPLYLRIEAIPEYSYLGPAERARIDELAVVTASQNLTDDLLDRDALWTAKRAALELVYEVVRSPGREAAYRSFVEAEGRALRDFATWCALAEVHGTHWSTWPPELQRPETPAVAAASRELAGRVDFHSWLQWLLDEQRAAAARSAADAGMPLGIVHDLAVGVHAEGADSWALQRVLAKGMSVGAPPDEFNQRGQVWSQPPLQPNRLAEAGYLPYRDVVRSICRYAGGVRVDHVMGLFRLWWVPEGRPANEGTYVRYDHEAMVGILALEAQRAGAVVIGEDLGTVEPWVREHMRERGMLGTSVLWFERDRDGPLAPQRWRRLCLATVDTHDLPPVGSYLKGEHLRLADRLGLLTQPYEQIAQAHARSVEEWLELLRQLRLLRPNATEREVMVALHRFLARTPALLVGVSVADAVGDRRPVNLPGTIDEYPNWRLPLTDSEGKPVLLEDLAAEPLVRELAHALAVALG
jgi:4-alpha-glucanotransferase